MSEEINPCAEIPMENREPLPENLITAIEARVGVAPSAEPGGVRILIGLTNEAGEETIYAMSVDVGGGILSGLSGFISFEPVPSDQLD